MCPSEATPPAAPSGPSPSNNASASTNENTDIDTLPDASVLRHLVDVHCHPTDARNGVSTEVMDGLQITVCTMSTHFDDQDKVRALAEKYPDKVVPCFGYHPWFSHLISTTDDPEDKETHYRRLFLPHTLPQETASSTSTDGKPSVKPAKPEHESAFASLLPHLPPPTPLSTILSTLRSNLTAFPHAMLGEVGLDRIFRVPIQYFVAPGARRELTPFTIPLAHQVKVLKAQLLLAAEMGRNVSVHSVKAQQATVALLDEVRREVGEERWVRVSVDMHSCGLSPETWRDLEKKHNNVFLSLSTVINHNHGSLRELISCCSPDRILAESDYNDISRCTPQTWDMVKIIAEVKGWRVESAWDYPADEKGETDRTKEAQESWGVVKRLEQNWFRFREGNHPLPAKKKNRRERQLRDYAVD